MAWSTKKRIVVGNVIGWGLAIIGAVMIPLMEYIIKRKVQDAVVIREGGPVYEYWENPPVPVYLQIYMFNITNQKEFLDGQKPSVNQVGPYTYSEERVKFNIIFNDNGTVSYRQKRIFRFIPSMSPGKETDMFLAPNPVYWALYNALKYEDPKVREAIYVATVLFDEHPLMYRSFKEVIWGYHDPLLNVTKAIDPEWFYTDYIGFFMNKNNTDDGVYTVYTGSDDINQLGIIDRYNGTDHVNFWSTPWANMVNGSDGTLGPPYLPKDETTYTFSSDICRSVPGVFKKEVETKGIGLWRFGGNTMGLANVSVNPDNVGFCTPTIENCLGAGLVNLSNCQSVDFFHLPVSVSFPHFLFGDPKYINAVDGMSPNVEEHNLFIDLEPYTGLVLRAAKRLQINVFLEPLANITETLNIKPVFLPLFWLNESATIDDKSADKFFSMFFTPLLIIHVTEIVLISLGALVLLSTVIYGVWKYRSSNRLTAVTGEPDFRDTDPIVIYDEDIAGDTANQNAQ